MKFLGEWIPQKSSKRKVKGFIDLSLDHGYGNDVKFFEIKKMEPIKFGGQKLVVATTWCAVVWSIGILLRPVNWMGGIRERVLLILCMI